MNELQEKIIVYYIAEMLYIWGNEKAKHKFLYDFKKAGDVDD